MLSCSLYLTPNLGPSDAGYYALFAIALESGAGKPQLRFIVCVWLFLCSGSFIPLPASLFYEIRGVSCLMMINADIMDIHPFRYCLYSAWVSSRVIRVCARAINSAREYLIENCV